MISGDCVLLLTATIWSSPATASEAWTYLDKPDCTNPVIWIAEELGVIERPDFECSIKDKTTKSGVTTYTAECLTDEPAVETMRVIVTPSELDTAVITWEGVASDIYLLCREELS